MDSTVSENVKHEAGEMAVTHWLRTLSVLAEGVGLIPSTHTIAINCLEPQSQGDPTPFLASMGSACTMQTNMQAKYP